MKGLFTKLWARLRETQWREANPIRKFLLSQIGTLQDQPTAFARRTKSLQNYELAGRWLGE